MSNYISGLVSVVIPTYKRADKLRRAIDSVLNQTYTKLELLVVNDNEIGDLYTKKLEKIMSSYSSDSRIRLVCQDKHINGAAARNAGIKQAVGEYIAFLDDDDYWAEEKLSTQVAALKGLDDTYGGVSSLYLSFLDDQIIGKSKPYRDGKIWKEVLSREVDVTTCSVLLRRTCLDDTGYFDESLKRHQEIQLFSYFTRKYKIHLVEEYLTYIDAWGENNPSAERIVGIKQDLFRSTQSLIDEMTRAERKKMIAIHNAEIAVVQLRGKRYLQGAEYLLRAISCPAAIPVLAKRFL